MKCLVLKSNEAGGCIFPCREQEPLIHDWMCVSFCVLKQKKVNSAYVKLLTARHVEYLMHVGKQVMIC